MKKIKNYVFHLRLKRAINEANALKELTGKEADVDLNHNTGKKTLALKRKCDKFIYFKTHINEYDKDLYIQCMRYGANQKIFLYSATTKPPKVY